MCANFGNLAGFDRRLAKYRQAVRRFFKEDDNIKHLRADSFYRNVGDEGPVVMKRPYQKTTSGHSFDRPPSDDDSVAKATSPLKKRRRLADGSNRIIHRIVFLLFRDVVLFFLVMCSS